MSEVVLENLIPFTAYNITISTVLHEKDKQLVVNTLETGKSLKMSILINIVLKTSNKFFFIFLFLGTMLFVIMLHNCWFMPFKVLLVGISS